MYIVVDTNKYSGNFERQMTAAATSQICDDCGVGIEYVDEAHPHAKWWEENIILQNDAGAMRPVLIERTPGFINDGMGGHYEDTPENRALAVKNGVQKLKEYYLPERLKIEKMLKEKIFDIYPEETCYIRLMQMEDVMKRKEDVENVYPAYQSIKIQIRSNPPKEIYDDFVSRVNEFAREKDIQILGVRII